MRDPLAGVALPLLRTALDLRDGWRAGTGPGFEVGRARLLDLFAKLHKVSPPVALGSGRRAEPTDLLSGAAEAEEPDLGPAYPLACWVDEIFTRDSPHAAAWNERKFEAEFHRTNDRAWRFWRQAELAADRPDGDLDVFFLCAALGFRGEWADDPARFRAWFAATRDRLTAGGGKDDWAGPSALAPPPPPPPLTAAAGYRRMAVLVGAIVVFLVPVAAFLVARQSAP